MPQETSPVKSAPHFILHLICASLDGKSNTLLNLITLLAWSSLMSCIFVWVLSKYLSRHSNNTDPNKEQLMESVQSIQPL